MVPDGHVAPEGKEWRLQQNNMEPQYSNQIYSLEQDTFLFGGDTDTSALCIIILYTGASYLLPLQYIGDKLRVRRNLPDRLYYTATYVIKEYNIRYIIYPSTYVL